jgi:hypothetical protein
MGENQVFDVEFLRWLAQLGVGGVIAGILFYFYRKDVKQFTELWQAQSQLNQRQTDSMILIVKENTAAFTESTNVLKSLHRRMDRLDILRVVDPNDESAAERPDRRRT